MQHQQRDTDRVYILQAVREFHQMKWLGMASEYVLSEHYGQRAVLYNRLSSSDYLEIVQIIAD